MKRLMLIFSVLCFFASCSKDDLTPYDHPYLYIATSDGFSEVTINSEAEVINTYNIYLSSKLQTKNIVVNYEIVTGNGLQEGVDYKLIKTNNSITFLPGIYDMPIRIRWLSHKLDETKNNTLTIRLLSNDQNITMGVPGPDSLRKEMVLKKEN